MAWAAEVGVSPLPSSRECIAECRAAPLEQEPLEVAWRRDVAALTVDAPRREDDVVVEV